MGVYDSETRAVAMNGELGKFVKVKWVRTNMGTAMDPEVRCRLVAQELGTVSGWTSCSQERPH